MIRFLESFLFLWIGWIDQCGEMWISVMAYWKIFDIWRKLSKLVACFRYTWGKYWQVFEMGNLASLLPVREIESSVAVTSTAGVCHVIIMRFHVSHLQYVLDNILEMFEIEFLPCPHQYFLRRPCEHQSSKKKKERQIWLNNQRLAKRADGWSSP